jgi:hypothetical protein
MPPAFELLGSFTSPSLSEGAAADARRVGLGGLLARRGHRARRVRVPGTAVVEGFRWRLIDVFTQRWWPQGIAVGEFEGRPVAITSWYAQPKRGVEQGSRLSVVDLSDPRRPRYHHVLLVAPRQTPAGVTLEPVVVHAGGIVWSGDRLLVAATGDGFREFRLSGILNLPRRGLLRRGSGPFGYHHVLPEFGSFAPRTADEKRLRYSFIALENADDPAELRLVSGEYSKKGSPRLARVRVTASGATVDETHVPGIPEMQGVALTGGTWFVTASRGDKLGGDLWVGAPGAMVRHEHALPPGPEDLALWPERRQLWSVTEFPGKRWVYAVDLDAVAPPAPVVPPAPVDRTAAGE